MFSSSSGAACLISSADAEVRWVDEGWDISAPVRRRTIPFTTRIRHPVEKDWVGSRCSRGLLVPFRSSDAGWRDLALWKLTDSSFYRDCGKLVEQRSLSTGLQRILGLVNIHLCFRTCQ